MTNSRESFTNFELVKLTTTLDLIDLLLWSDLVGRVVPIALLYRLAFGRRCLFLEVSESLLFSLGSPMIHPLLFCRGVHAESF